VGFEKANTECRKSSPLKWEIYLGSTKVNCWIPWVSLVSPDCSPDLQSIEVLTQTVDSTTASLESKNDLATVPNLEDCGFLSKAPETAKCKIKEENDSKEHKEQDQVLSDTSTRIVSNHLNLEHDNMKSSAIDERVASISTNTSSPSPKTPKEEIIETSFEHLACHVDMSEEGTVKTETDPPIIVSNHFLPDSLAQGDVSDKTGTSAIEESSLVAVIHLSEGVSSDEISGDEEVFKEVENEPTWEIVEPSS